MNDDHPSVLAMIAGVAAVVFSAVTLAGMELMEISHEETLKREAAAIANSAAIRISGLRVMRGSPVLAAGKGRPARRV